MANWWENQEFANTVIGEAPPPEPPPEPPQGGGFWDKYDREHRDMPVNFGAPTGGSFWDNYDQQSGFLPPSTPTQDLVPPREYTQPLFGLPKEIGGFATTELPVAGFFTNPEMLRWRTPEEVAKEYQPTKEETVDFGGFKLPSSTPVIGGLAKALGGAAKPTTPEYFSAGIRDQLVIGGLSRVGETIFNLVNEPWWTLGEPAAGWIGAGLQQGLEQAAQTFGVGDKKDYWTTRVDAAAERAGIDTTSINPFSMEGLGQIQEIGRSLSRETPMATQIGAAFALDPLNYIPGLGIGGRALREAEGVVKPISGALRGLTELQPELAKAHEIGQRLSPVAPDVVSRVKNVVRDVVNSLIGNATAMDAPKLGAYLKAAPEALKSEQNYARLVVEFGEGITSRGGQTAVHLLDGAGEIADNTLKYLDDANKLMRGETPAKALPKAWTVIVDNVKRAGYTGAEAATELDEAAKAHMIHEATKLTTKNLEAAFGAFPQPNLVQKAVGALRSVEALVYIGLSPVTLMRNWINNKTTMALEGINPFLSTQARIARIAQVNPAKAEALRQVQRMSKQTFALRDAMNLAMGEVGRSALTGGVRQPGFVAKFPSFMKLYEKIENADRALAWENGAMRALKHNWTYKNWLPGMDSATEAALLRIDPSGGAFRAVINAAEAAGLDTAARQRFVTAALDGKVPGFDWTSLARRMSDNIGRSVSGEQLRAALGDNNSVRQLIENVAKRSGGLVPYEQVVNEELLKVAQTYQARMARPIATTLPVARQAQPAMLSGAEKRLEVLNNKERLTRAEYMEREDLRREVQARVARPIATVPVAARGVVVPVAPVAAPARTLDEVNGRIGALFKESTIAKPKRQAEIVDELEQLTRQRDELMPVKPIVADVAVTLPDGQVIEKKGLVYEPTTEQPRAIVAEPIAAKPAAIEPAEVQLGGRVEAGTNAPSVPSVAPLERAEVTGTSYEAARNLPGYDDLKHVAGLSDADILAMPESDRALVLKGIEARRADLGNYFHPSEVLESGVGAGVAPLPEPRIAALSTADKLTELEGIRKELEAFDAQHYRGGWANSLSSTVGHPIKRPTDLAPEELDHAIQRYGQLLSDRKAFGVETSKAVKEAIAPMTTERAAQIEAAKPLFPKRETAPIVSPSRERVHGEIRTAAKAQGMNEKGVQDALDAIDIYADNVSALNPDKYPNADAWYANRAAVAEKLSELKPSELAQQAAPTSIWYSQLERSLVGLKQEKMTADQMRAMLVKSGVKPDEMKWTGLDDYLTAHPKATRQEALDYVRANRVDVQEVMKGGRTEFNWEETSVPQPGTQKTWIGKSANNTTGYIDQLRGNDYLAQVALENAHFPTLERAKEWVATTAPIPTKYSQYTTPGGENYRELLLTLPVEPTTPEIARIQEKIARGETLTKLDEENLRNSAIIQQDRNKAYRSTHWEEPNVLAHVRFNDRVDVAGKKTLFIEEIQSDWHQAGREKGYNRPLTRADYEAGKTIRVPGGVPDAPFTKTWDDLVLKRMVRYSAENGYDQIAWTTGKMQAERYDLAKFVDRVDYLPSTGNLNAFKDGKIVMSEVATPQKLQDYIGKEAADRLLNRPTNIVSHGSDRWNQISGIDLQVGGEGMKGFYDKILVEKADKLGKKWGAKVGETQIPVTHPATAWQGYELQRLPDGRIGVMRDGLVVDRFDTMAEAQKATSKITKTETVHSLPITPAMRESVLREGQPLFQGALGASNLLPDYGQLVKLFEQSNPTTIIHEFIGHSALEDMATADFATIAKWADANPRKAIEVVKGVGGLGQDEFVRMRAEFVKGALAGDDLARFEYLQEQFAYGLERFMRDGPKGFTQEVADIFRRVAEWFRQIYEDIANHPYMRYELSDDVRTVYRRLFEGAEEVKAIKASEKAALRDFAREEVRGGGRWTAEQMTQYFDPKTGEARKIVVNRNPTPGEKTWVPYGTKIPASDPRGKWVIRPGSEVSDWRDMVLGKFNEGRAAKFADLDELQQAVGEALQTNRGIASRAVKPLYQTAWGIGDLVDTPQGAGRVQSVARGLEGDRLTVVFEDGKTAVFNESQIKLGTKPMFETAVTQLPPYEVVIKAQNGNPKIVRLDDGRTFTLFEHGELGLKDTDGMHATQIGKTDLTAGAWEKRGFGEKEFAQLQDYLAREKTAKPTVPAPEMVGAKKVGGFQNVMPGTEGAGGQGMLFQQAIDDIQQGARRNPVGASDLYNTAAWQQADAEFMAEFLKVLRDELMGLKPTIADAGARTRVLNWLNSKEMTQATQDAARAAQKHGDWMEKVTVMDYGQRYNIDNAMAYAMPFPFWRNHYAVETLRRTLDHPRLSAFYLNLAEQLQKQYDDPSYPERLKGKSMFPLPFLPSWMNGGVFFDPLETLVPVKQVFGVSNQQPREAVSDNDVAQNIRIMAQKGAISIADAELAITNSTKSALWRDVKAQLEKNAAETGQGMDIFGLHSPLQVALKMWQGKPDEIGALFPFTRLARAAQGTGIPVVSDIGKAVAGIEPQLRKTIGLPEYEGGYQYRIDRMLSHLVAQGEITGRDALIAMMERKGTAYELATQRALAEGGVGSILPLTYTNVYPVGEQKTAAARVTQNRIMDEEIAKAFAKDPRLMQQYERAKLALTPDQFKAEVFDKFGFTASAKQLLSTVPLQMETNLVGGGGGYSEQAKAITLGGSQYEGAIHELAHAYFAGALDKQQQGQFEQAFIRLAADSSPQNATFAKFADNYLKSAENRNDTEYFASLASFSMGNLQGVPEYIKPYYDGLFTGKPKVTGTLDPNDPGVGYGPSITKFQENAPIKDVVVGMTSAEKWAFASANGITAHASRLSKFLEAHPEIDVKNAAFDEQEVRLKDFLVNEFWGKYSGMTALDKRVFRDQADDKGLDTFINKETRDYSKLTLDQLAGWTQKLNGYVPKAEGAITSFTPEKLAEIKQYAAQDPALSKQYDVWLAQYQKAIANPAYQDYLKRNDEVRAVEDGYYALPEKSAERRAYLAEHPELKEHWDWTDQFKQQHPEVAAYIKWNTDFWNANPKLAALTGRTSTGTTTAATTAAKPAATITTPRASYSSGGGGGGTSRGFAPSTGYAPRTTGDLWAQVAPTLQSDPELYELIKAWLSQAPAWRATYAAKYPKLLAWLQGKSQAWLDALALSFALANAKSAKGFLPPTRLKVAREYVRKY